MTDLKPGDKMFLGAQGKLRRVRVLRVKGAKALVAFTLTRDNGVTHTERRVKLLFPSVEAARAAGEKRPLLRTPTPDFEVELKRLANFELWRADREAAEAGMRLGREGVA